MNNYDYYRTHKSEIDAAIMGLSMPQDGSALGGLLVIVAMVVALYVGVIAIALPSATQKILLKCYNRADNTPNRSTKGMMQAHPKIAALCRVHTVCFLVAGAITLLAAATTRVLHLPVAQNPISYLLMAVYAAAICALMGIGLVLVAAALAARHKAKKQTGRL